VGAYLYIELEVGGIVGFLPVGAFGQVLPALAHEVVAETALLYLAEVDQRVDAFLAA
jgi:hypothetical protein